MDDFDDRQARQEVQRLHQLAEDAETEGQYATMERLLEHAVSVAQRLDDLPLLIKERYWLACAQEMQSKTIQAIATYSWLIGLATDPASSQLLTNSDTLRYLSRAFSRFVGNCRSLPEMQVSQLLRVVADGLDWLERVGKANWAGGLRLEKGRLLRLQGDMTGARLELEAALALARRNPEHAIYTLTGHQLVLADLLWSNPFKAYREAIALAEEVVSATTSLQIERWWAYRILGDTRLSMGEYEEALSAAQQSRLFAQAIESPFPMTEVHKLLGQIYRETGHLVEAAQAVAQEWHWARRSDTVKDRNDALRDCARVRNLQARVACGLPVTSDPFPEQIPAEAQVPLVLRRVQSVHRFVRWATPLAARRDRQSGRRNKQEELDEELQAARELEIWLVQKGNK